MIIPWNKVKVVKDGETIEFDIQQTGVDGKCYVHVSPLPNEFIITIDDRFGYPANFFSDGARREFHDMCILSAIASKLFPGDSAVAFQATQQMRCSMRHEQGTVNVIVTL